MHHATGIQPGEPLDPARLLREIQNAEARGSSNDAWCWVEEAIPQVATFKPALIQLETASTEAAIGLQAGLGLPAINPPTDADTFVIPYVEGYSEVEAVSWESSNPELLLILASLQYWRQINGLAPWNVGATKVIRAQVILELDGGILPGSGPLAYPPSRGSRGAGLSDDSAGMVLCALRPVLPGSHSVRLLAGQAPAQLVTSSGEAPKGVELVPPSTGVNISSRGLHVIRIAMGQGVIR